MPDVELRTGAWYGDTRCTLAFPESWSVTVHWPKCPQSLSEEEIRAALDAPVGQPPIQELCRSARRATIIIDDLKRPTPVARVLPHLLDRLSQGGLPPDSITIVMATGTHGPGLPDAVARKLGPGLVDRCRVVVHNPSRDLICAGRTSFGTPVKVNREVAQSNFVIGIGGIYPNHTAGFGGGAKLALGVLGFGSIERLHNSHPAEAWGRAPSGTFRRDLDEIAAMIGLRTTISMHLNADREPVRIVCGDQFRYFAGEVAFALSVFGAPPPSGEDVVVCSAYPNDLSLTIACMKGMGALRNCGMGVSRVMVAALPEGIGSHGLYPFLKGSPVQRASRLARRVLAMDRRRLYRAVVHRLRPESQTASQGLAHTPLWLYRPGNPEPLPGPLPGIRQASTWQELLAAVQSEHPNKRFLEVSVYPCAPLQFAETVTLSEPAATAIAG